MAWPSRLRLIYTWEPRQNSALVKTFNIREFKAARKEINFFGILARSLERDSDSLENVILCTVDNAVCPKLIPTEWPLVAFDPFSKSEKAHS